MVTNDGWWWEGHKIHREQSAHTVISSHSLVFWYYHPTICLQCWAKSVGLSGLVTISAICCIVAMAWTEMSPHLMCLWKWWYLILRCFILGCIFGTLANSRAPVLSSKSQQCTLTLAMPTFISILVASFMRLVMGITSHKACDSYIFSFCQAQGDLSLELWSPKERASCI